MKRDYGLFLKDIVTACQYIQDFVAGMSYSKFLHDKKTTSAVIRQFEIIGEAAKNIPDSIRKKYSKINWKDMTGMRDRLIHGYFGVDYHIVWDTIANEIPKLKTSIEKISREIEANKSK